MCSPMPEYVPAFRSTDRPKTICCASASRSCSPTAISACVVVHGHTPTSAPVVRANRIGIDTGAVFGGPLTCAVLEGVTLGFLTARAADAGRQ